MKKLRHHSLVAWQRADDLFIRLHKDRHSLVSRIRAIRAQCATCKAAYSVPANIVEGFGRRHRKDRLHFLNIAEASLAEAAYCVHAAWRLGYINDSLLAELEKDLNGVGAPLSGLSRSLKSSDDAEE